MMKQWIKPKNVEDREWYKTNKCGLIVAYEIGGKVYFGWSFCDLRFDKFDKDVAESIAVGRCTSMANKSFEEIVKKIPFAHFDSFVKFIQRSRRYYKDKEFPIWANEFLSM